MKQYTVTGMSCAACSARVEKAVKNVPGVQSCSVSLLTNSMGVEGDADAEEIINAVKKAGYGAYEKGIEKAENAKEDNALADTETPLLKRRLILSAGFLLLLMYVSMGHTMFSFPLPSFLEGNPIAITLVQMLLALTVILINNKFYVNGVKGIVNKAPNMDTLVSLGSCAGFVYSTASLFVMTSRVMKGDIAGANALLHDLYFESSAMILVLITVGKMLEARSKGKTTDALKSLMKLTPKTAVLIVDGEEKTVPASSIKIGDVFVVKSGQTVPADGTVIEGSCAVDESSLTGESIPSDKEAGDYVCGGTINRSGFIKCTATKVGEDTVLSQIIKTVSDAAATKAPIAKVADKVSGIFVPVVITVALIASVIWLILGKDIGFAVARGISVLVISCPCALGLATPVAIMVSSGVGAKNGILFKTAASLEQAGKTDIVALDKTGTVTSGTPTVTDIKPYMMTEDELMSLAVSLEVKSEHPLAKAIVTKGIEKNIKPREVTDFEVLPGNGIMGKIDGIYAYGGNLKFISEKIMLGDDEKSLADSFASDGKTPVFFAKDGKLCGIIAIADVVKEESIQAVKELKNMGIRVVMITGDNEKTANAIAKKTQIDEVIAGVLPSGKESEIIRLKREGKVIMVGDGINDAPALTRADIGVAIGAGTDVAMDAADIVLMKSRLTDVPALIRLSRAALKNIHQNLFWAFIYNSVGIPLAAGVFIPIFGWQMNPMFGAAAMSLSSFCVVTNALRLNFVNIYSTSKDKKKKKKAADMTDSLQITLKVKGMMCSHCESRVKKALEELSEVQSAEPDFKTGTVFITLKKQCDSHVLKKAITEAGYKVVK